MSKVQKAHRQLDNVQGDKDRNYGEEHQHDSCCRNYNIQPMIRKPGTSAWLPNFGDDVLLMQSGFNFPVV